MGLISPGGENLLDFHELQQVLSNYDGDHWDPYWWPQERPFPMRVARGPLGIPVPSMPGPKTCVESVPEPDVSSPVLTWILGYFPGGFPSRLSHEAFPRGFPTGLSHVPPWSVSMSILSLKVEAVQGKQVSLEWTETSWGLWER